jgi:hypothetical protein
MYPLGVSRPSVFQFPATDIPSSSTLPMFQAQPSTFDTATQDQLAWDEFGYDAILGPWMAPRCRPTSLARHS